MTLDAYYMTDHGSPDSPRRLEGHKAVPLAHLGALGVTYMKISDITNEWEDSAMLQKIRHQRGYVSEDEITCDASLSQDRHDMFFAEHFHDDEEIRFVLDGSGYFDVRDYSFGTPTTQERWIRMHVHKGDLIILPAGCYHRFSLDKSRFIKALRLFQQKPSWVAINRITPEGVPHEANSARVNYEQFLTSTCMGVEDKKKIFKVWDVWHTFFPLLTALRDTLPDENSRVYVYYTGQRDPLLKASWCPDCNDITHKSRLKQYLEAKLSKEPDSKLIEVVNFRDDYKPKDYILRTHPDTMLTEIPTLMEFTKNGSGKVCAL